MRIARIDVLCRSPDCQPGLAAAARPNKRDKAALRVPKQCRDAGQFRLAPDKGRGWDGQVVEWWIGRLEWRVVLWQAARDHLVDTLRADQISQDVLAQIAQGNALWEMIAQQVGGCLAEQNLPAVTRAEQAPDAVEIGADIIVAAFLGHAGV